MGECVYFLLRIANATVERFIDLSIDGEPGITFDADRATTFETNNLALENKHSLESKYNVRLEIVDQHYIDHRRNIT